MSLIYQSLEVWDVYEEADYILHKNFALPLRSGELFTKIASDGLLISSSYQGIHEEPASVSSSGAISKFVKEDLLNITKPTLLAYKDMQSVRLDEKRGMFQVMYKNEPLRFRITNAHKSTLREASRGVEDLFLDKGIAVEKREFKITDRYNKFVIFLVIITALVSIFTIITQ